MDYFEWAARRQNPGGAADLPSEDAMADTIRAHISEKKRQQFLDVWHAPNRRGMIFEVVEHGAPEG